MNIYQVSQKKKMKGAQNDPLESEIGHPYLTVQLHIEIGIIKTSYYFSFF